MRLSLTGFFFFLTLSFYAEEKERLISKEEAKALLIKVSDFYTKTKVYSVKTKVNSYQSYDAQVHNETSDGIFYRSGACISSLMMGIRTIQNETIKVVIDTAQKIILIANPDSISDPNYEQIKQAIDFASEIYYTSNKEDDYIRFVFSNEFSYQRIEMKISSQGFISKYVIYYAMVEFEEDGMIKQMQPRLEFLFSNFKTNLVGVSICDTNEYIKIASGVVSPAPAYTGFELMDTRIKQ